MRVLPTLRRRRGGLEWFEKMRRVGVRVFVRPFSWFRSSMKQISTFVPKDRNASKRLIVNLRFPSVASPLATRTPAISTNTPAAPRLHRDGDQGSSIPIPVSPLLQIPCSSANLDIPRRGMQHCQGLCNPQTSRKALPLPTLTGKLLGDDLFPLPLEEPGRKGCTCCPRSASVCTRHSISRSRDLPAPKGEKAAVGTRADNFTTEEKKRASSEQP